MSEAREVALKAKEASRFVATASTTVRNQAVVAMAEALRSRSDEIVQANSLDMSNAREKGTAEGLLDRLLLTEERIDGMASGLEDLVGLPDPLGKVLEHRTLDNGLDIKRVSVPMGVVALVYEARPNVTADAAGICIKTGNACVLRGGSLAFETNMVLVDVLRDAIESVGLPADGIVTIHSTDRAETAELLKLRGIVDLLIPRGGAGLIDRCVREATVPVIETGTGNCHIYIHSAADFEKAIPIIINAKTQRIGVCNAAESLLVDQSVAREFLPIALKALSRAGVTIHGDATTQELGRLSGVVITTATEEDWGREYLSYDMSVKVVSSLAEAVEHVNRYGTGHSEAIITEDATAADEFLAGVDAAAVYVNASTRFTDGGQFGLGAEIGISTQKIHVRGPFALEGLTTYKYEIRGTGQVRD